MQEVLSSRRWMLFGVGFVILVALGVLLRTGDDDDEREFVPVDNTADLLANIEGNGIELALAPGEYIVPACSGGLEQESSDPTCGQMQQGDNSVLASDLELELDSNGVPTGVVSGGAVIDCGGLPPSALEFSCLVAGKGSTVRNLTIRNGLTTPDPDPRGGDPIGPDNRNGIMIVAGKAAVVDEVHLLNTRRGVLFTRESGSETRGVVRHSLIDGTELAGIYLHARNPDGSGTSNSQLRGEIEANRLTRIGRHPLLLYWTFSTGIGNESHAKFTENIIDSTNVFGISISGNAQVPAQDNTAFFEIEGGRLEGDVGLYIGTSGGGGSNSYNCVVGEVKGLTIENGEPAVWANFTTGWGTGNRFLLEMKNSVYISETSGGEVRVTDDAGSDFHIAGTPEEFMKDNTNLDISDALLDFTGDDLDDNPCDRD